MSKEIVIERGDIANINGLKVEVLDIVDKWGETFIDTEYGEFNIDLITSIEN